MLQSVVLNTRHLSDNGDALDPEVPERSGGVAKLKSAYPATEGTCYKGFETFFKKIIPSKYRESHYIG